MIGFNHLPDKKRFELIILTVELSGEVMNGELQRFEFPEDESNP
jgi:hypothetical protein